MKSRGFTLLELLGVIVILALLTTLVFPSVLNVIKKSSDQTDKISMDLINNAADIYIENHTNSFKKRNGSKFIIDMKELIEDGNLPSNLKISDIEDIEEKCVQVTYINNKYSYELKDKGNCEYFIALPEEYQQVEYIKSTGTQWLDTGFIPNQDTRVVCEYEYHTRFDCFVFGARKSVQEDAFCFMASGTNGGQLLTSYNDSGNAILFESKDFTRHKVDKNKNLVYLDDVLVHTFPSGQTFTPGGELEIFATYNGGAKGYLPSNLKMYYFKLYDNGTLIRNFVPCYRKLDNVIGMYDLVEDKFYTNSGTGTFEKGQDI